MPRIYELDSHVADLIAAGEVVERPASVIKELMENSIDAGAGIITVEIKAGGMTYIRVTDDGCGISPEDAGRAFLRHATSKLRSASGLEAIGTLGFRGEALAAVASVSRIELLTRERGAEEGVRLALEAGTVTDMSPAGCPEGTTIIVRDLFYNTPARLKFMKTDRAEGSGASAAVLRCALSRPEVSVRFIKDGKTECHTPGDSRADSCIYSLFGRDFASGLLKASTGDGSVTVEGYVSSPSAVRGNRSYQFFFVNGRHIRSRTLGAALEQAYANTLMSGRYPACVLYITISAGAVDVNVHPAKTEVRFLSDKQVFDGVYYAALGALESLHASAEVTPSEGTARLLSGSVHRESAGQVRAAEDKRPVRGREFLKSMPADDFRKAYSPGSFKTSVPADNEKYTPAPIRDETLEVYQTRFSPAAGSQGYEDRSYEPAGGASFRVIGEALGTYVIAEREDSVWFIDKHAAHERIHFDRLRTGNPETMSQSLITPVICRPGYEDSELLLDNAELLDRLGFSVESFGDDAVAVRRIPSDINLGDAEPALAEIAAELRRGGIAEPARRDNILRTIACKAAIKAGSSSDIRELEELAGRVLSGEIRYCPHGRPVAFELTKSSLDRSFKRI